jgi:tartrate dehydratase beta subunit/fumarate hydratase class I family protein
MRYTIFTVAIILCLAVGSVHAGDTREIELVDGSVITGEIVSMNGGVYTIRSEALGTIKIEESKIRAIRATGAPKNVPDPAGQMKSLQERMTGDQEIMEMIQALKDDEEFQKALQDPEIMTAVSAGDIAALMANPKFMSLLNNRTVKDIQKKVEK